MADSQKSIVAQRPAESAAVTAASIVTLLALVGVEVSEEAVVAVIVGIGVLPGIVTAIVNRVRGL